MDDSLFQCFVAARDTEAVPALEFEGVAVNWLTFLCDTVIEADLTLVFQVVANADFIFFTDDPILF